MEDFENLLDDVADAFRVNAFIPGISWPIKGRFRIDPYDVTLSPGDPLNVTQIWFYYEPARVMPPSPIAPGVRLPAFRQRDQLIIHWPTAGWSQNPKWQLYEVIRIDRDDLGEHALQLLEVPWEEYEQPVFPPLAATVEDDDETATE